MPKLTRTIVAAMIRDPEKDTFLWDSTLPGFGVKMSKAGGQSFVFQYRAPRCQPPNQHRSRFRCLELRPGTREGQGTHARALHDGIDPLAVKVARRKAMTVAQLCDAYTASPSFAEKAELTQSSDRGRILRHIKPLLGNKIADVLTGDDVKRMRDAVTAGKTAGVFKTDKLRGKAKVKGGLGAARQCVVLIASIYEWARREKLLAVTSNPAADVDVEPIGGVRFSLKASSTSVFSRRLKKCRCARKFPTRSAWLPSLALAGGESPACAGVISIWRTRGSCCRHPNAGPAGRPARIASVALPAPVLEVCRRYRRRSRWSVFPPAKGAISFSEIGRCP